MKKILVFIDSSLAELDWINPFLVSKYCQSFDITIIMRNVNFDKTLKNKYFEGKQNIKVFNTKDIFYKSPLKRKIHKLLFSFVKKLALINIEYCTLFNYFKSILFKNLKTKIDITNRYDFIFRDEGLGESFEINCIINNNPKAFIVCFPHCLNLGIARRNRTISYKIKKRCIQIDLFLENTSLSDKITNNFFVSGAPGIDYLNNTNKYFDKESNNIIILTRDVYEPYGAKREDFLRKYDEVLKFCQANNFNVFVKHHPREKVIEDYENIENRYSIVRRFGSFNDRIKYKACLTAYSTAGLYFTLKCIPVFDMTPYCKDKTKIYNIHYFNKQGFLTHDLIEFGFQDKLLDIKVLKDNEELDFISKKQSQILKKYFPENPNKNIYDKLMELI